MVDPASLEGGGPPEGGGGFQEPLLQRYVSTAELQAALLALELRLLQNVSQQLEGQHGEEDAAGTALTQKVMGGGVVCLDVLKTCIKKINIIAV